MLKSKVLKVLEENKGKTVSGAEMAKTLNLSRTSIWKAINSLRDDGYNINAVTNRGYSLADNTHINTCISWRVKCSSHSTFTCCLFF